MFFCNYPFRERLIAFSLTLVNTVCAVCIDAFCVCPLNRMCVSPGSIVCVFVFYRPAAV